MGLPPNRMGCVATQIFVSQTVSLTAQFLTLMFVMLRCNYTITGFVCRTISTEVEEGPGIS